MTDRTLDRLIRFDRRSRDYPLRTMTDGRQPRSYSYRHYTTDQGRQGACALHAVTQEAAARPVPVFGDPIYAPADVPTLNALASRLYARAQEIDEFPGTEPQMSGTSILAAMKVGAEQGWWDEYRWALGSGPEAAAQDVILALGHKGPVVIGSTWKRGMWRPDSDGYLNVTGPDEGGHGYLLTSYSKKRDAVWTPNSWGGDGQGWITRSGLATLLAEDGVVGQFDLVR